VLPAPEGEKLETLIRAVPEDDHMIHGDFHVKNVTLQGDECLILDMDTLSCGHPVFELASMYNAYCGFNTLDPRASSQFLGLDPPTARTLWDRTLALYLGEPGEAVCRSVEDKAALLGHARLLRRSIRRDRRAAGDRDYDACLGCLVDLLHRVDSLTF
jgi:hypothetical protein